MIYGHDERGRRPRFLAEPGALGERSIAEPGPLAEPGIAEPRPRPEPRDLPPVRPLRGRLPEPAGGSP